MKEKKITMAMEIIYLATATLTKLSILTFYRRISSSVLSRPLLGVIWGSILFGKPYSPQVDSFIYMLCIFTLHLNSIALRPRKHPRPTFHMLSRRSLLVPLHHFVATHTLIPLRRRSRLPRVRHYTQHRTRLPRMSHTHVCSSQTASSVAAETWSCRHFRHGIGVRIN
jgi:hypothetical protein